MAKKSTAPAIEPAEDDESDPSFLKLPSGGWVRFRELDELTGAEYQRLKSALSADPVQLIARGQTMLAQLMIDSWEIPGQPGLPIPNAPKNKGVHSYNQLTWRDMSVIEAHTSPWLSQLFFESAADDEGKDGGPSA